MHDKKFPKAFRKKKKNKNKNNATVNSFTYFQLILTKIYAL